MSNPRPVLAHKNDCSIHRNPDTGYAILYDCDGNIVFDVDDTFTDSQIWHMLIIANRVYRLGWECGEMSRSREILNLLNGVHKE